MSYKISVVGSKTELEKALKGVTEWYSGTELDESVIENVCENFSYGHSIAVVIVDGKLLNYYDDSMESEDARFHRDLLPFLALAEQAYSLGVKHGKESLEVKSE